jgi:hypothetical protein
VSRQPGTAGRAARANSWVERRPACAQLMSWASLSAERGGDVGHPLHSQRPGLIPAGVDILPERLPKFAAKAWRRRRGSKRPSPLGLAANSAARASTIVTATIGLKSPSSVRRTRVLQLYRPLVRRGKGIPVPGVVQITRESVPGLAPQSSSEAHFL